MRTESEVRAILLQRYDQQSSVEVLTTEWAQDGNWRVGLRWRKGPKLGRGIVFRSFGIPAQAMEARDNIANVLDGLVRDIDAWAWGQDCIAKHGMIVGVAGKPRSRFRTRVAA